MKPNLVDGPAVGRVRAGTAAAMAGAMAILPLVLALIFGLLGWIGTDVSRAVPFLLDISAVGVLFIVGRFVLRQRRARVCLSGTLTLHTKPADVQPAVVIHRSQIEGYELTDISPRRRRMLQLGAILTACAVLMIWAVASTVSLASLYDTGFGARTYESRIQQALVSTWVLAETYLRSCVGSLAIGILRRIASSRGILALRIGTPGSQNPALMRFFSSSSELYNLEQWIKGDGAAVLAVADSPQPRNYYSDLNARWHKRAYAIALSFMVVSVALVFLGEKRFVPAVEHAELLVTVGVLAASVVLALKAHSWLRGFRRLLVFAGGAAVSLQFYLASLLASKNLPAFPYFHSDQAIQLFVLALSVLVMYIIAALGLHAALAAIFSVPLRWIGGYGKRKRKEQPDPATDPV